MKRFYHTYGLFVALLSVVGFTSCNIKEDLSNCPGTFLLDYTAYSEVILDEIDPTSEVNIYVFDEQDICSDILTYTYQELKACDFEFKVPITYMGRNVLVWHGTKSADYDASSMQLGERLDDFYLKLIPNTKEGFGHVPDLLWASELEKVEFCASKTRHRIHMVRLHTVVNVGIDLQHADGTVERANMYNYEINIEATSDRYHRDYTLCGDAQEYVYDNSEQIALYDQAGVAPQVGVVPLPGAKARSGAFLDYGQAGTLRICTNCTAELSLLDLQSGKRVMIGSSDKLDLLKYMLESRGDTPSAGVDDQRFLDLNKVWTIDLLLDAEEDEQGANAAIKLTINGWTVWFDNVDLD